MYWSAGGINKWKIGSSHYSHHRLLTNIFNKQRWREEESFSEKLQGNKISIKNMNRQWAETNQIFGQIK